VLRRAAVASAVPNLEAGQREVRGLLRLASTTVGSQWGVDMDEATALPARVSACLPDWTTAPSEESRQTVGLHPGRDGPRVGIPAAHTRGDYFLRSETGSVQVVEGGRHGGDEHPYQ
jgi:hypothetical protein